MNPMPLSTFRLPSARSRSPISNLPSSLSQTLVLLVLVGFAHIANAEPSLEDIHPSQTSLLLAQANPGSAAAVSSQAVATQPEAPKRSEEATPPQPAAPTPPPPPSPAPDGLQILDPRLDPDRPKGSQLKITTEQTLLCGEISVTLPAGTYEQKLIVENPEGRRAIATTSLKPQQVGLGYIRYGSDVPLKVNGVDRSGGLDVPIRKEDNLPVRVWYRKMTEVDDVTKAFTFILPPVGLIAGAGAWSSGNVLVPDTPPTFTEARDYFLKDEVAPKSNPTNAPTLTPLPTQRKSSGQRTP